jgi:hypothetical protein
MRTSARSGIDEDCIAATDLDAAIRRWHELGLASCSFVTPDGVIWALVE